MAEPPEAIVTLLNNNWDTNNYSPKPTIDEIWDEGKTNVLNTDYVLVYEASYNASYSDLNLAFRNINSVVRVDIRTKTRSNLISLKNEVERVLHASKTNPDSAWSFLKIIGRTDLTDKARGLFRYVLDVELVKIGAVVS